MISPREPFFTVLVAPHIIYTHTHTYIYIYIFSLIHVWMIYSGNYTIWPYVNKIIEQSQFLKMQSIYFQKCDGQFFFKRAERQKSYVSVPLQERSITCRPNAVHTSVRRYITWDGSEISLELSRYLRGAPGTQCCHFRTSYVRYIARELHRTAPNRMWEIWILPAVGKILQLDIPSGSAHRIGDTYDCHFLHELSDTDTS